MVLATVGTGAINHKKLLNLERNTHLNKGRILRFSEVRELEGIGNSGVSYLTKLMSKKNLRS